jgi:ankyrin repeat protein
MSRDSTDWFQHEQLHFAAQDGDLARVEELLQQKYPLNCFDELGKTPLHYAVEGGHLHVVDRLIQAGADVNAHDARMIGNTPLSDNARECSYEMARRLIDAGADPTVPGWMQLTALHRADERKDPDAQKIQRLLKDAANRRRE